MDNKYDIWMKFYVSDYVGDTMQLGPEEHGIYLLLILHYWKKQGPITDNLEHLKRIARVESTVLLEDILEEYFTHIDGGWRHKRIEKELLDAKGRSEKAAKAAEARWKNKPVNNANAMLTHSSSICSSDASQSQSQSQNKNSELEADNNTLPPAASGKVKNEYSDEFESFWKAYPKKREKLEAFKEWKKVKSILPPIEDILSVLEKLKMSQDWVKEKGKFIPYPARWLKKGGWEAEVEGGNYSSSYRHGGSVNFEL